MSNVTKNDRSEGKYVRPDIEVLLAIQLDWRFQLRKAVANDGCCWAAFACIRKPLSPLSLSAHDDFSDARFMWGKARIQMRLSTALVREILLTARQ